ncbi:MAG: hypothetical protein ACD_43C00233G0001, partial [uncultured bacterium]
TNPVAETATNTTTVNTNVVVPSNTNITVQVVESAEAQLSESDANLRDRAAQVQTALTNYYSKNGSYPADITALQLTTELTGITYTPIGSLPAMYYDLAVAYSTGAKIINP